MKLGWRAWQILALLLLAVLLVSISVVLELTNVIRLAIEGASTESALISNSLFLQIRHLAGATSKPPLEAIREDPRIGLILQAAMGQSPSVVFVAICDSASNAVAHTTPNRTGTYVDSTPRLPDPHERRGPLKLLLTLNRAPESYIYSTPLRLGPTRFATIRIGISGVLLRQRVGQVFHRGLMAAGVQVALALALGFFLVRIMMKRIRILEAGVTALREGRFDRRIPETGLDEFARLARDLNLLSEQFQRERESHDTDLGSVRQTVELLGEGVMTLGPDRRLVLINGPTGRILGLDAAAAHGKQLEELLAPDHPVRRLADQLFEDERRSLTVPLPQREGGPAYVAVGHRITETGAPGGVLIEFKETAALAQLHSLVDQSRVLSRLGQMAAGVAHEIGNPLQTIEFELGALRQSQNLNPEEVNERARSATEEIQRLQRAVSGFLKVAKLRELAPAPLSVNELLEETQRDMEGEANLSGLDLELDLQENPPEASCDREVLKQAVENIVKNAIQALPSKDGKVTLRSRVTGTEIRISVADTGPGIPPDHLDKVSNLYFTTKKAGTGVGLALVRQAVELHGGELEIRSEVGDGTVVTLRIPLGSTDLSDHGSRPEESGRAS